jgi:hypothetical protein
MANDEKRATGFHHHKEVDYSNPVDMSGFSKIHFMLAGCLTIGLILIVLFVK